MSYTVHDKSSAPEGSRALLEQAESGFGFVPNLLGIMAESPALLEAYMTMNEIFDKTDFNASEKQIVLLAASPQNDCGYCKSAHQAIAAMQDVPSDVARAAAEGEEIGDEKLEALRRFTAEVVSSRGLPAEDRIASFLEAGYERRHVLDVITGVGMKTLSNYTNHIAKTPVDEQFES